MKTIKIIGFLLVALFFGSCEGMDENYKDYLTDVKVYSPRVTDLTVVSGLKEVTLYWKNQIGRAHV